jgi:cytidylate kinase
MAIVTIDGYRGSGSTEVGTRVAQALNANYVDRLLLRKAAEKAQAPIGEFVGRAGRDHHPPGAIKQRLHRLLERWVDFYSRNSLYVNPWDGFAFVGHNKEIDEELVKAARIPPRFVDDRRFITSISSALEDMAQSDNLVIVGRGGASLLKDFPNALHIGLAAPFGTRVIRNMRKHHFTALEAAKFTRETDNARQRFYKKFFDTTPDNPSLYTLSLNTNSLHPELASELILSRAAVLGNGRQN